MVGTSGTSGTSDMSDMYGTYDASVYIHIYPLAIFTQTLA